MITLLLLTIGAIAIFVYKKFGKPKHRDLIQTTLSLVASCLLYQFIIAALNSPADNIKQLSVHTVPASSLKWQASSYSYDPVDNNLIKPTKVSLNNNSTIPPLPENYKNVDKMPTCGSCSELDNDLHDNYDMQSQSFIWPATGKIIQSFHESGNDGINISVCSGTSVRAIEGGEIAYAGEELAGYGKMVLIRHPNGFVSAYAHNSELNVIKGDRVKRGQVIAKSGQSGNVGSPQLHFELRKGSIPLDPIKFMPDNNKVIGSN